MRERQSRPDLCTRIDLRAGDRLGNHRDEARRDRKTVIAERPCTPVGGYRSIVRKYEGHEALAMLAKRNSISTQQSPKAHRPASTNEGGESPRPQTKQLRQL